MSCVACASIAGSDPLACGGVVHAPRTPCLKRIEERRWRRPASNTTIDRLRSGAVDAAHEDAVPRTRLAARAFNSADAREADYLVDSRRARPRGANSASRSGRRTEAGEIEVGRLFSAASTASRTCRSGSSSMRTAAVARRAVGRYRQRRRHAGAGCRGHAMARLGEGTDDQESVTTRRPPRSHRSRRRVPRDPGAPAASSFVSSIAAVKSADAGIPA